MIGLIIAQVIKLVELILLACASCVIAECPEPEEKEAVDLDSEGEDDRQLRERIPQAKANVALCWSKYFLDLLKVSSERIVEEDEEDLGMLILAF